MDKIVAILVWGMFAVIFGVIFYNKFKGQKEYKDVEFQVDNNWFENSVKSYPKDNELKYYFFHFDKELLHQGSIIDDEEKNTIYEIKFLYNNGFEADEVDFVNHIINKTHHHKVGKTFSTGVEGGGVGATISSSFKFDGVDIFEYLHNLGYDFKFEHHGLTLAYHIDIIKNHQVVAKLLSSNGGKNLYERDTEEVVEKAGSNGYFVLQCAYEDLDATILYAMAFERTELSVEQLHH